MEKMVFALSLLLFSLTVRDMAVSLITFTVMSALIIFAAKIPLSYYLKLLLLPGFFILSGTITILFSFTSKFTSISNIWWSWKIGNWQIFISDDSFGTVANLITVVFCSISCLYFLTLTTPITVILSVLRKLKVPSLLVDLIELTYRFIFIFLDTALAIHQSQASRLGYGSFKERHSISRITNFIIIFRSIAALWTVDDGHERKRLSGEPFLYRGYLHLFLTQLADRDCHTRKLNPY